jgi:hypothetical protein
MLTQTVFLLSFPALQYLPPALERIRICCPKVAGEALGIIGTASVALFALQSERRNQAVLV